MKNDTSPEGGINAIFVHGLSDTPGWLKLSRTKQDDLLQHTAHIQQFRQMHKLGKFGELVHLVHVQLLLDDEEMDIKRYLALLCPSEHQRTIHRKAKALADIAATIPNSYLHEITQIGQDVLAKFDKIPNAALGDIRNALHKMPLLPVSTEQGGEKFLEELNDRVGEERKQRRKIGLMAVDMGIAEKTAVDALIHHICKAKLKTSAEKRQFLTRVIGWTMEDQAIHGTLRASRVPIPNGVIIRRDRPRKHLKPAEN